MSSTYDLAFGENTPYAHALGLLTQFAEPGGVVLDIGAGHGPLGGPATEAGFTYIGVDIDEDGLAHIESRGLEAHRLDLAATESLVARLGEIVDGRAVAAILALDIIEHLPDSRGFIEQLRTLAISAGRPPLVVSIPNVAHYDVAAKLLVGRWDVTASGLLDRTHLALYTDASLTEAMNEMGWYEAGRADFELYESDQHFPALLPGLASGSALARYLRGLRDRADGFGSVNQFVRAYTCGDVTPRAPSGGPTPAISVILRTQGNRIEILSEALLSLAGQTNTDFEVLLMVHSLDADAEPAVRRVVGAFSPSFSNRVRIIKVKGGDRAHPLNVGLHEARGDYVAFLDDDDLVTATWIQTFVAGRRIYPGAIIRAVTADQTVHHETSSPGYSVRSGPVVEPARVNFSMVRHLETNRTPICSFAVPRSAVLTYGIWFDESLRVLEDWHFLVRAALICGVHDTRTVTSIYRRWDDEQASWHSIDRGIWSATRKAIQLEIDSQPILLPAGSVSFISEMIDKAHRRPSDGTPNTVKQLKKELATAHRRIQQIESSTSWRVTRPLRALKRWLGPNRSGHSKK